MVAIVAEARAQSVAPGGERHHACAMYPARSDALTVAGLFPSNLSLSMLTLPTNTTDTTFRAQTVSEGKKYCGCCPSEASAATRQSESGVSDLVRFTLHE